MPKQLELRSFMNPNSTIVSLSAGLFLLGSVAQAQQPVDYYASDSIQAATRMLETSLVKISLQPSNAADPFLADTLASFRLLLDLNPTERRRYVLPRQAEFAKTNAQRVRKLFDSLEAWMEFVSSFEALLEALDQAVDSAEAKQDFEAGYRLRWQLAGLNSVLPIGSIKKYPGAKAWSHADALNSAPEVRKAFANHPKTLWPAGSYSVVSTPHFAIASQSEAQATNEVAILCEQSFALWKQVFFDVWANEHIAAPGYAESLDHKFSVVLFRNREAYRKALRSVPDIGVSTGYYDPNQKVALFYWDGSKTPSTVVHELTHQFFYEASRQPVLLDTNLGKGFWVVEGVALYMESMSTRACGGSLIADIGGWDAPRLQAGRYRRLHDKYWVPWDDFHAADGKQFRSEEDIRAWYSQATGLAHLWLDGTVDQRNAFARYVASVYVNNENPTLLGPWNDDQNLRDAFDQNLILGPSKMLSRPFYPNRREAVLSRSRVASKTLLDWPVEFRTTPWLDLSFSQVDDELFVIGGKNVVPIWNIQRLNLESTKITDISMPAIAESKNLSELDLSNCKISDLGVTALKDHKSLKTLWLNQCEVSDASIDVLLSIPQLEAVHLSKTKISSTGWSRLLASKPRFKSKSTSP